MKIKTIWLLVTVNLQATDTDHDLSFVKCKRNMVTLLCSQNRFWDIQSCKSGVKTRQLSTSIKSEEFTSKHTHTQFERKFCLSCLLGQEKTESN